MIPGTCKHRGTDGCQHSYNLHIHDHFSFANVRWETWSVWSLILTLLQQEPPSLTIVMSHMTFQKLAPDGQNIAQWPKQDPEHIFIARENFPPFTCCQLLTQRKCTHSIELHLHFLSFRRCLPLFFLGLLHKICPHTNRQQVAVHNSRDHIVNFINFITEWNSSQGLLYNPTWVAIKEMIQLEANWCNNNRSVDKITLPK